MNNSNKAIMPISQHNLALRAPISIDRAAPYVRSSGHSSRGIAVAARTAYLKGNKQRFTNAFAFYGNMILCLNDTCGYVITDAVEALRKEGKSFFRHKVKLLANTALRSYTKKDLTVEWQVFDMDVYYSLCEHFHDNLERHIETLRLSVLNVLTRLGIEHREALSYVVAARDSLYISRIIYDGLSDVLRITIDEEICGPFKYRCLNGVKKTWDELYSCLIDKQTEEAIEKDKNYKLACDIFFNKATSQELLDEAIFTSIMENKEKFTPEQLREYTELCDGDRFPKIKYK